MKLIRPLLIASTLLTTLPAFALPSVTAELPKDGAKKECRQEGCPQRGFDSKLKLSDEQREKLGSLRDQFKLSTATQQAELEVSYRQMGELLRKPTIDKQAVLALQTKINGLRDNLSNAKVAMMLSASDVFTPEQRAEFSKMHGMRGNWNRHEGGRHEGGRHEGGRHEGARGAKIG